MGFQVTIRSEYIHKFLEVYFDDWTVFGLIDKHIGDLRLMLEKCRRYQISLNLKKCIFCAPFGIFWVTLLQQTRLDGRSHKDCHHCKSSSTQLSQATEDSTWSYWVLQKIHQGLCKDYGTNGKTVKERYKISME